MGFVKGKRCVIAAAGEPESAGFVKNLITQNDFVIAADAGYFLLESAGITPDLIVGDFDSAEKPRLNVETITLNPVKDCTDTEFAVEKAVEMGYRDILILGALGGRIDHSFANITITAQYKNKGVNIILTGEGRKIYALKDETHILNKTNSYVSVFAFGGDCTVTLEGMFYPLKNYVLSPFCDLGVSNEIVCDNAKITVSGCVLIVMEVAKE